MSSDPERWRRLVAFDIHAKAFTAHGRQSAALGDLMAEADIGRLWRLSGRVARALAAWRGEIAALELAGSAPLEARRAACLVSESFFDEALTPLAYAVFDKALDLALDSAPQAPRRLS